MLNREQVEQRQEQLREQIALLPQKQRKHFYQRWQKQVKDPDSYAVLNYLLLAGLHHFYLGKWLRGAVNLLISVIAILLVTLGAVAAWFRLISGNYNSRTACSISLRISGARL